MLQKARRFQNAVIANGLNSDVKGNAPVNDATNVFNDEATTDVKVTQMAKAS